MRDRTPLKKSKSPIPSAGNGRRRVISLPPPPPITDTAGVIQAIPVAFAAAATWVFVDCANIAPEIRAARNLPHYVLLKVKEPIEPNAIAAGPEAIKLPLGKLHHLYSAGLQFGYLLELPRFVVQVRPTIVSVLRNSAVKEGKFEGATLIQQTPHISVFFSEDGAMLVCFNEQHRNLSAETLRGSAQG